MVKTVGIALISALAAANVGATTNRVACTAVELAKALRDKPYRWSQFDLTATVTFPPGPRCRTFAVEDATGPVVLREVSSWPNLDNKPLPVLHRGDRVRVKGHTSRHADTSYIVAEVRTLETLSSVQMPPIPSVPAEKLNAPEWQNRPVRLRGMVQDAFRDEIDTWWNYLVIRSGRDTTYATFTTTGKDDDRLRRTIGAEVEIAGLNTSFNPGNRRMIGRLFIVTGWDAIDIVKSAPANPFDVPTLDAEHDTARAIASGMGHRRDSGRVIAVWHGDRTLMRTRDGRIVRVDLARKEPPRYGASIEAAGIPETDLYRLNLSRAVWRKTNETFLPEPPPCDVTVRDLTVSEFGVKGFQTDYHGKAIRINGIVRSIPSPGGDGRLALECDRQIVPIDASACPEAFAGVEIGCTLDAAGICVMETENWRPNAPFPHVEGFSVIVRTPKDIRILSHPPWWTAKRLMAVIGTLLALLAGIAVWNRALNRRAERRGQELADEKIAHVTADLKVYERTRLAVELHDSLSQNLTGVSLAIRAANRLTDSDPVGMKQSLDLAVRTLDSCRDELRNCLWDLRNQTLEEPDMNEAIRQTLKPHVGDAKLHIRFNIPRERLSDNTAHAILRIVRELAANAIRHGAASEISVAGAIEGDRLLFSVTDNGTGFDPEKRPTASDGHFGLQGIQDRVDGLDGEMTVRSHPGKGTKVSIALKLRNVK